MHAQIDRADFHALSQQGVAEISNDGGGAGTGEQTLYSDDSQFIQHSAQRYDCYLRDKVPLNR